MERGSAERFEDRTCSMGHSCRGMITLSRDQQLAVVAQAAHAPSAHNSQPARWRFLPDGAVLLLEDARRRLEVSDPSARDRWIGLGAAFEGMRLALSWERLDVGPPEPAPPDDPATVRAVGSTLRPVARAAITPNAAPDPLATYVTVRRTYRRRFLEADVAAREALGAVLDGREDVIGVYDPEAIAALARLSDRVTFALLARPAYQAELYRWTRFTPGDPRWHRDGLTADCLGLPRPMRVAGQWLFVPPRFAWLARFGLHRPLVAEAHRIRTATALAIVHRDRGSLDLTPGRRFYRFWLEITRAGFHARPMTALVDDPGAERYLRHHWRVPQASALVNVFAIGKGTPAWDVVSPRLPPEELLV